MPSCAAVGCTNHSLRCKEKNLTLFTFPKDEERRKEWIKRIMVKRMDSLPNRLLLCEEHFSADQFDPSVEMRIKLTKEQQGSKRLSRKLLPNAVPNIFPHSSNTATISRPSVKEKIAQKQMVKELLKEPQTSTMEESNDREMNDGNEGASNITDNLDELAAKIETATKVTKKDAACQWNRKRNPYRSQPVQCSPQMKDAATQTDFTEESKSQTTPRAGSNVDFFEPTNAELTSIFEENHLESLSNLLGLPSLPTVVRSVYEKFKDEQQAKLNIQHPCTSTPVKEKISTQRTEIEKIDDTADQSTQSMSVDASLDDDWLTKSEKRAERKDPDYEKSFDGNESLRLNIEKPYLFEDDCMFLVYESQLKKLFKKCECGSPIIDVEKLKGEGCQQTFKLSCLNGCQSSWSTQPALSSIKGSGNLAVTAAADIAGISYPKLKRFGQLLNLSLVGKTTYYKLRGQYVFPEIKKVWTEHQRALLREAAREERVSLGIDGQCDSPGHNATYCTVTAMDVKTNKVLDFEVVNVKEVKNSQGMEKEGFIRVVDRMDDRVNLDVVSTDRHTQIKKLMREAPRYRHIKHQLDPWHFAKNIKKKLLKLAKKKGMDLLGDWESAIINHLYWCIQTCGGDSDELVERFTSCIHHVCNRHDFVGNKKYRKCEHAPYPEDDTTSWMVEGSKEHDALKKVILNQSLLKDMRLLNLNVFTTYLEVFHSLKIRYLPKSIFFEQEKMEAGMMIACLDHNLNIDRDAEKLKKPKEGHYKGKYKIAYHRWAKRFVAKRVKQEKSYDFMRRIVVASYYRALDNERSQKSSRKRTVRAPEDRPSRDEIIAKSFRFSRF